MTERPISPEELRVLLASWRSRNVRRAWRPVTTGAPADSLSFFGGAPSLEPESSPVCGQCSVPMSLLLQLNLHNLPKECGLPLNEGLLGVFACTATDGCDLGFPFSESSRVLLYPSAPTPRLARAPNPFPRVSIAGWQPFDDLPDPDEHGLLGLQYAYPEPTVAAVDCDEPPVSVLVDDQTSSLAESFASAATGDKLGGWAKTIQGPAYVECTDCSSRMRLLFQIDSLDNLRHIFGDGGIAHVLYCPQHPRITAYCWQCS